MVLEQLDFNTLGAALGRAATQKAASGKPGGCTQDKIRVFARFRPRQSTSNAPTEAVDEVDELANFSPDHKAILVKDNRKFHKFELDYMFDGACTQKFLYDEVVPPILKSVLKQQNGTIIAYGQTGSGKTFTMQGPLTDEKTELCGMHRGIIPRVATELCEHVQRSPGASLTMAFYEVYRGQIRDLLRDDDEEEDHTRTHPRSNSSKRIIVQEKDGCTLLQGLGCQDVQDAEAVLEVLRRGESRRVIASTSCNARSGRAHALVDLVWSSSQGVRTTLRLIDLAGTEQLESRHT